MNFKARNFNLVTESEVDITELNRALRSLFCAFESSLFKQKKTKATKKFEQLDIDQNSHAWW